MLYVIDSLAPGGAETSLALLAPHLEGHGIELHVAYLHEREGLHDDLRGAGATLHHVAGGRVSRVRRLTRLTRDVDADLVHTTLFEADIAGRVAARLARRPVVTSYVSTGFELGARISLGGLRSRGAVAADALTAQLATAFHAVSEPVADVMSRRARIRRDRFTVIPRGREPDALGRWSSGRRASTRHDLQLDLQAPVVLAVGRQVAPKRLTTLVDAVPLLQRTCPGVRVLIAGAEGSGSAGIRRSIDAHGLRQSVHLLGHRSDVPDLMVAADVLAFPSIREGFPGTLVEALALECPIVASDIPTVRAVVDGPGGPVARLVPPADPAALAAAIEETLRAGRQTELTERGRRRFEESFTTAATAIRWTEWYRRVTEHAAGKHG